MAAPFQNYSGGVLLADIVKRNNLSTYVSEAIKERSMFIKSGAVVRNALLDAREGGTRIQVPEFNPVSPTEEIFDGTCNLGYQWRWLSDSSKDRYRNPDCIHRSPWLCLRRG